MFTSIHLGMVPFDSPTDLSPSAHTIIYPDPQTKLKHKVKTPLKLNRASIYLSWVKFFPMENHGAEELEPHEAYLTAQTDP